MEKTRRAGRGGRTAGAFPGIQADVVMIAPRADEGGLAAEALLQLEAEDAAIEGEGAVDIGNLEMNVADIDARIDGAGGGHNRQDTGDEGPLKKLKTSFPLARGPKRFNLKL